MAKETLLEWRNNPDVQAILGFSLKTHELRKLNMLLDKAFRTPGKTEEEIMIYWQLRGWGKQVQELGELSKKAVKAINKWELQSYGYNNPEGYGPLTLNEED